MKVLCPTDFSAPSRDGVEFASRLAQALSGSLTLYHVQPSIWPEAMQLRNEVERSADDIRDELELFRTEVVREFGITCDWKIDRTTDTVEGSISRKAMQYDLMVMGTNGADSLYQYVFGSNTYQVITESKCPVLMVPEGTSYRKLKRIVYAFDPESNPIFLVDQLKEMARTFAAQVMVVHVVTEGKSKETEHKMEIIRDALQARDSTDLHWEFHHEYAEDVPEAVDRFMRQSHADLLAISYHYRNLAQRLFRPNVIRRISMIASYPVLIFHK